MVCLVALAHVDDAADAVTGLHVLEGGVDLVERLSVGDELIDLELASHVVVNEVGKLGTALDTTEGTSLPDATSDELERSSGNFLSSSGNTNDDTLTPTLVASLESRSHNVDITSAVEGVVTTTISHFDELLLNGLVLELHRVDEVCGTELLSPLLLAVVDVDDDNLGRAVLDTTLYDRKTDTASTEDSNVGALLDTTLAGSDDSGTVTGGDTTAEQASAVHRGLVGDLDD